MRYIRPLVQTGPVVPSDALILAGGWAWFTKVEILRRAAPSEIVPITALTNAERDRLVQPRAPIAGLSLDRPRIMGILNTTPDSFSDGGAHVTVHDAVSAGLNLADSGADMIDIGGESTRPGAAEVATDEEVARTAPVIAALREAGLAAPISIDTRKAAVARCALQSGATLINDVSGFTFDPDLGPLAAKHGAPVCIMHSRATPKTMQSVTKYDDLLLDIYDALDRQIVMLEGLGVPRHQILADPGIGFAKDAAQNISIISRISLFHSLGTPILLGASRKRFIGLIGGAQTPSERMPGSIAVALAGLAQGVQMVRVHDVFETAQAVALWQATFKGTI